MRRLSDGIPHTIKLHHLPQRFNEDKRGGCALWTASMEAPWSDCGENLVAIGRTRRGAKRSLERLLRATA